MMLLHSVKVSQPSAFYRFKPTRNMMVMMMPSHCLHFPARGHTKGYEYEVTQSRRDHSLDPYQLWANRPIASIRARKTETAICAAAYCIRPLKGLLTSMGICSSCRLNFFRREYLLCCFSTAPRTRTYKRDHAKPYPQVIQLGSLDRGAQA